MDNHVQEIDILKRLNKKYSLNIEYNNSFSIKYRKFYNDFIYDIKSLPDMRPISRMESSYDFVELDKWNDDRKFEYVHQELKQLYELNVEEHIDCWKFFNNLPFIKNFNNENYSSLFDNELDMLSAFYKICNIEKSSNIGVIKKHKKYNFLKTIKLFCITYPSISYLLLLKKGLYPIAFLGDHHASYHMTDHMLIRDSDISHYSLMSTDSMVYDKINISDIKMCNIISKSVTLKNKTLFVYLFNKHNDNDKYKNSFINGTIILDDFSMFTKIVNESERINYLKESLTYLSINIFSNLVSPYYLNDEMKENLSFKVYMQVILNKFPKLNIEKNNLTKVNNIIELILKNCKKNIDDIDFRKHLIYIIINADFSTIKVFLDSDFDMFSDIVHCYKQISPMILIIIKQIKIPSSICHNIQPNQNTSIINFLLNYYDVTIFQLIYDINYFYSRLSIYLLKLKSKYLQKEQFFELNYLLNSRMVIIYDDYQIPPQIFFSYKRKITNNNDEQ